jgi:hypothetical protein
MGAGNCAKAVPTPANKVMQIYKQAMYICVLVFMARLMSYLPQGENPDDSAEFKSPKE